MEDACVDLALVSAFASGRFCEDIDDWEITKKKRWINWRSWNFDKQVPEKPLWERLITG